MALACLGHTVGSSWDSNLAASTEAVRWWSIGNSEAIGLILFCLGWIKNVTRSIRWNNIGKTVFRRWYAKKWYITLEFWMTNAWENSAPTGFNPWSKPQIFISISSILLRRYHPEKQTFSMISTSPTRTRWQEKTIYLFHFSSPIKRSKLSKIQC